MTSKTLRSSTVNTKLEQNTFTSRPKPKHGNPTSAVPHERNAEPYAEEEIDSCELSTAAMGLCKQVLEVYNSIDGNPADGRWTTISQLLKPPCTRGKYGVWFSLPHESREGKEAAGNEMGVEEETGVERASSRLGPRSTQDRKVVQLKEKVEKWQMDVVIEAEEKVSPRTTRALTEGTVAKRKSVETKVTPQVGVTDPSPLGFFAQKPLPSQLKAKKNTNKINGKQPDNKQSSDSSHPPETTSTRPILRHKAIIDIPENDFLPPSFSSSQVQHSTPFRKPQSFRRPPSPIPRVDTSTSDIPAEPPLTSSPFTNGLSTSPIPTETRNRTLKSTEATKSPSMKPPLSSLGVSCSLPAFGSPKVPGANAELLSRKFEQSSSTSGGAPAQLVTKRPLPRSPQVHRPAKQRRIEPHDNQADVLMHVSSSPLSSTPVTPQKRDKDQLPTLTELLQSARKSTSSKGKGRKSGTGGLDISPIARDVNANRESSARIKVISTFGPSPQSQAPSNKIETQRTTATSTTIQGRQPGWEDLPVQSEDPHSLPVPEYSNVFDFASGYGFDITVPPKSMSPIDSEDLDKQDVIALLNAEPPDSASLPRSSANHPVLVPDSPAIPDFTFNPEAFAPQLASTQQKDAGGGGNLRGDVFLNSDTRGETEDEFMFPSSPQNQKKSPVRGAAARFSSLPISRSPSKTPSKSQSQSRFPFGYSSQMDLEGRVDQVSRFLEKDISMVDVEEEDTDTYEAGQDKFSMGTKGWMY